MSHEYGKHYQEARHHFNEGLAQLGLVLDDDRIHQLILYCLELQKWNRKVNLVAKNTPLRELIDKHFLDSLTIVPVLTQYNCLPGPLLDVGSGAGFPGLVLKIACPDLATVLLEPRHRRVSFLKHIIRMLALEKIDVLMHRTDDRDAFPEHHFMVITGRAVADVAGFLAMTGNLASRKTLIICMQGTGGRNEWEKTDTDREFEYIGVEKTLLPLSGARRFLLLFRKQH